MSSLYPQAEASGFRLDWNYNFDRFVEMHNARTSGDHETAKAIADELGLKKPMFGKGHGMGKGKFHQGNCPYANGSN